MTMSSSPGLFSSSATEGFFGSLKDVLCCEEVANTAEIKKLFQKHIKGLQEAFSHGLSLKKETAEELVSIIQKLNTKDNRGADSILDYVKLLAQYKLLTKEVLMQEVGVGDDDVRGFLLKSLANLCPKAVGVLLEEKGLLTAEMFAKSDGIVNAVWCIVCNIWDDKQIWFSPRSGAAEIFQKLVESDMILKEALLVGDEGYLDLNSIEILLHTGERQLLNLLSDKGLLDPKVRLSIENTWLEEKLEDDEIFLEKFGDFLRAISLPNSKLDDLFARALKDRNEITPGQLLSKKTSEALFNYVGSGKTPYFKRLVEEKIITTNVLKQNSLLPFIVEHDIQLAKYLLGKNLLTKEILAQKDGATGHNVLLEIAVNIASQDPHPVVRNLNIDFFQLAVKFNLVERDALIDSGYKLGGNAVYHLVRAKEDDLLILLIKNGVLHMADIDEARKLKPVSTLQITQPSVNLQPAFRRNT